MLPILLLSLACAPSTDANPDAEAGWVEIPAERFNGSFWRAESPVEGPAPVQLYVSTDEASWAESASEVLWLDQGEGGPLVDVLADAPDGEVAAVYYVWVEE